MQIIPVKNGYVVTDGQTSVRTFVRRQGGIICLMSAIAYAEKGLVPVQDDRKRSKPRPA